MVTPETDNTLTVDANVIKYHFQHIHGNFNVQGLNISRMEDFCNSILPKYSIAINDFIRQEYDQVENPERVKNWLTKRYQENLAIPVECIPLPQNVKCCLNNDYGFDCSSIDSKYIQTCMNTRLKHLITQNTQHFFRPHRNRRRKPMSHYLKNKLSILILTIDECCNVLVNN